MYILVNNSSLILGLFSSKETLCIAAEVVRENRADRKLYWKEVKVDNFDKTLLGFHTIHPENLNEVPAGTNHEELLQAL